MHGCPQHVNAPIVSPDAKAEAAELTMWNEDDLNVGAFPSDSDRHTVDTTGMLSVDNVENYFCNSSYL